MKTYKDIDTYIKTFSPQIQKLLKEVRVVVNKSAPKSEEAIRYGIPTLRLRDTNLVHFAGYEHHIGFYPTSSGIKAFKKDLAKYKTSKGTVQFPLDKPLPSGLITRITKFRVKEVLQEEE